jgi:hypothetical protein
VTAADDEGRHPPGTSPLWGESWSFEFFQGDGSVGGYVRLGVYPGRGVAWYWAYLAGPGRPVVAVRDHEVAPPRGRSLEVRAEGLWSMITCETPHEHWTVGLEAFAVAMDDPADAYRGERGDPVPLGYDLEWERAAPVFRYTGWPAGSSGYHQACEVHGEVLVGDERIEIDGWGERGHTWGEEDWWAGPGWSAGGRLGDGTVFHAVQFGSPGRSCQAGYVARAGEAPVPVPSLAVSTVLAEEGLPQSAAIRLGPLALTLTPVAHAPLVLESPGGRFSRLPRSLCRVRDGDSEEDGGPGLGWASWLQPPPGPAWLRLRLMVALTRSRFMRAMVSMLISFGHTAAHSPMLVQFPNPIESMVLTMSTTRRYRSA